MTPIIPIKNSEKKRKIPENQSSSSYQAKMVNSDIDPKKMKITNSIPSMSLVLNRPKASLPSSSQVDKIMSKNLNKNSFIDKIGDFSAFELKKKQEKEKEKIDEKTFVVRFRHIEDVLQHDICTKGWDFCCEIKKDVIIPKRVLRKVSIYGLGLEFNTIQCLPKKLSS
jgi:hypothetical protein